MPGAYHKPNPRREFSYVFIFWHFIIHMHDLFYHKSSPQEENPEKTLLYGYLREDPAA